MYIWKIEESLKHESCVWLWRPEILPAVISLSLVLCVCVRVCARHHESGARLQMHERPWTHCACAKQRPLLYWCAFCFNSMYISTLLFLIIIIIIRRRRSFMSRFVNMHAS